MKNLVTVFLTFAIALFSTMAMYGEDLSNKYPTKLSFNTEKEAQIVKVAKKVAQEIAPKFKADTLVPVIYSTPYAKDDNVVDVYFMKDENDYIEYQKGRRDPATKRLIIDTTPLRRPNSILTVTINKDTLEPVSIYDSHSRFLLFEPSYADFRKNNPNKQFEPYLYPAGENIIF